MLKNLPLEQKNIFHLLSIRFGGLAIIRGGRIFSKSLQIGGGGGDKLKSEENIENLVIDTPYN